MLQESTIQLTSNMPYRRCCLSKRERRSRTGTKSSSTHCRPLSRTGTLLPSPGTAAKLGIVKVQLNLCLICFLYCRSNTSAMMRTTVTVNLDQQQQETPVPFCLHDTGAIFSAIKFTYPTLVRNFHISNLVWVCLLMSVKLCQITFSTQ